MKPLTTRGRWPVVGWEGVVTGLLGLAAMPFFRGGRDPAGLLFICFILFLAVWRLPRRKSAVSITAWPRLLLWSLAGIALWSLLSLSWTLNLHTSLIRLMYVALAGVGLWAGQYALARRSGRSALRQVLVYAAIPVALYGWYLFLSSPYDRAASFFYAPNEYNLFLSIIMLLLLSGLRKAPVSRLNLVLIILFSSQLFLTQSVAGLTFWVAVSGLYLLLKKFPLTRLRYLAAALATGLCLALLGSWLKTYTVPTGEVGTPDAVSELVSTKGGGFGDRVDYALLSLDIVNKYGLFGVGLDNFQVIYPRYQPVPSLTVETPHNALLQVWVELGVVGVLLLGAAVFSVLKVAKRAGRSAFNVWSAAGGLLVLHALFNQPFRYPSLWILAALVLMAWLGRVQPQRKAGWLYPLQRLAGWLFTALLLIPAGLQYYSTTLAGHARRLYQEERDVLGADEILDRVNRLPWGSSATLREQAFMQLLMGERERAEELVRQAVRRDGSSGQNYATLALILDKSGKTREARFYYELALKWDRANNPDTYTNYARMMLKTGQDERVKVLLDRALGLWGDEELATRARLGDLPRRVAFLYFERARIAHAEKEYDYERELLQKSLMLRPDFLPAQEALKELGDRGRG